MNEDFNDSFITIEDEEGNQHELEILIDNFDYDGSAYSLLLPADMDENDPDYGFIILRSVYENGEFFYEDVEDEKLLQELYDRFMAILYADEDEDEAGK